MAAVGTANAAHVVWGRQCDGWHLLLGVIGQCMPPGSAEVRHRHARAPVVLRTEGTAALAHDGVDHRLAARPGEHVPSGSAHQMRNGSTAQLRFLEVSSPRSHGDREAVDD